MTVSTRMRGQGYIIYTEAEVWASINEAYLVVNIKDWFTCPNYGIVRMVVEPDIQQGDQLLGIVPSFGKME